MDFFNKLLHRNSSGGGGSQTSSPLSLSAKASDSISPNKSESHLKLTDEKNENGQKIEVVDHSESKTEKHDESRISSRQLSSSVANEEHEAGEEEDKYEDAQEEKFSLTILAEDLDKIHLSTPGKHTSPPIKGHEFIDIKQYSAGSFNFSSSCLDQSHEYSEVSFNSCNDSIMSKSSNDDSIRSNSSNKAVSPNDSAAEFTCNENTDESVHYLAADDSKADHSSIPTVNSFDETPISPQIVHKIDLTFSSPESPMSFLRSGDINVTVNLTSPNVPVACSDIVDSQTSMVHETPTIDASQGVIIDDRYKSTNNWNNSSPKSSFDNSILARPNKDKVHSPELKSETDSFIFSEVNQVIEENIRKLENSETVSEKLSTYSKIPLETSKCRFDNSLSSTVDDKKTTTLNMTKENMKDDALEELISSFDMKVKLQEGENNSEKTDNKTVLASHDNIQPQDCNTVNEFKINSVDMNSSPKMVSEDSDLISNQAKESEVEQLVDQKTVENPTNEGDLNGSNNSVLSAVNSENNLSAISMEEIKNASSSFTLSGFSELESSVCKEVEKVDTESRSCLEQTLNVSISDSVQKEVNKSMEPNVFESITSSNDNLDLEKSMGSAKNDVSISSSIELEMHKIPEVSFTSEVYTNEIENIENLSSFSFDKNSVDNPMLRCNDERCSNEVQVKIIPPSPETHNLSQEKCSFSQFDFKNGSSENDGSLQSIDKAESFENDCSSIVINVENKFSEPKVDDVDPNPSLKANIKISKSTNPTEETRVIESNLEYSNKPIALTKSVEIFENLNSVPFTEKPQAEANEIRSSTTEQDEGFEVLDHPKEMDQSHKQDKNTTCSFVTSNNEKSNSDNADPELLLEVPFVCRKDKFSNKTIGSVVESSTVLLEAVSESVNEKVSLEHCKVSPNNQNIITNIELGCSSTDVPISVLEEDDKNAHEDLCADALSKEESNYLLEKTDERIEKSDNLTVETKLIESDLTCKEISVSSSTINDANTTSDIAQCSTEVDHKSGEEDNIQKDSPMSNEQTLVSKNTSLEDKTQSEVNQQFITETPLELKEVSLVIKEMDSFSNTTCFKEKTNSEVAKESEDKVAYKLKPNEVSPNGKETTSQLENNVYLETTQPQVCHQHIDEDAFKTKMEESFLLTKEGYPLSANTFKINKPSRVSQKFSSVDFEPCSEDVLNVSNSEMITNVSISNISFESTTEVSESSPVRKYTSLSPSKKSQRSPKSPVHKPSSNNPMCKVSPKLNSAEDFKSNTSLSPKSQSFCKFFVNDDKETDDVLETSPEFDERLAEEAANLSCHILSMSQGIQDSDSESDHNKTVIKLEDAESKHAKENSSSQLVLNKPSKPQTPVFKKPLGNNETHGKQLAQPDSIPIESYMQSMRAVLPAHLNQSEAGPITADELNTQDLEFQDGANLDLDFFNRVGNTESCVRPSLIRDSLYVKFDPIVGAIVSNTLSDSAAMPPPPGLDNDHDNNSEGVENDTNSNETVTVGQGDADKTPIRSPALEAVQKLISLTPPSASANSAPTPTVKSIYENYYWSWCPHDRASVGSTPIANTPKSGFISQEQLKKELKKLEDITKERELYFESELSKKVAEVEKRDKRLCEKEAELKAALEREQRLKKDVQERTKSKQQLSLVMEEYEKTIAQLVAQKEEEKKESELQKELLIKERDTAMQHLNNMEIAFNDVHQKYERSKTVIEGMKANENLLKKSLEEYDEAIKASHAKYDTLKNHAIKQLDTANQELDLLRRANKAETDKLKAMVKKAEVRVKSLEESLEQKSKENQELTAICDELISKVGSGN